MSICINIQQSMNLPGYATSKALKNATPTPLPNSYKMPSNTLSLKATDKPCYIKEGAGGFQYNYAIERDKNKKRALLGPIFRIIGK